MLFVKSLLKSQKHPLAPIQQQLEQQSLVRPSLKEELLRSSRLNRVRKHNQLRQHRSFFQF